MFSIVLGRAVIEEAAACADIDKAVDHSVQQVELIFAEFRPLLGLVQQLCYLLHLQK